MAFHYLDDKEYVDSLDDIVRAEYPGYADKARDLINDYLRKYDRHRWRVFNGEAADRHQDLSSLGMAHGYVALLLESRDHSRKNGGVQMSDQYLDSGVRAVLQLPFSVIDGGKSA